MAYGKAIRKIIQVGKSSGVVLPKDFLATQELERGDSVEVIYKDNVLKLKPIEEKELEAEFLAKT
ncbi:hypothetical protein AKJ56_01330 [candidate division MSBL1 archaeon SCGC-AAA382N08]|uniref:SpoVT-AbrB domain-containing protein n=1 Tax=candidate division MSBL1 archaeon SCGC-AAA382N08 TaxID=1698285 RepID=A0A133VPT0_9EURY|nr:hypothetical protein AKJ56_01330 [candidate division MSBL1 archaeon SCGC-AAA382N08]